MDERLDPLVEALEAGAEVGQPLHMGQIAARLDGEHEARRSLLHPAGYGRMGWEPVERGVHFDRVEQRGVVLEPAAGGKPLWIDALAPVRVVPARAADPDRLQRRG